MKKSQEEMMFVFSLILISIVLTIAFITFTLIGKNSVEAKIYALQNNELNINLLNYLRTNTSINNFSIADLTAYSYYNKNYDDLERITKDIFNNFYSQEKCPVWSVTGIVGNNEIFKFSSDFSLSKLRTSTAVPRANILDLFGVKRINYLEADAIIPGFNQEKIKIRLIEGCLNE